MADDKAKYEISLIDKYSKNLNKIDKETQAFDSRVLKLGKTMVGVFAGAAVIGGAVRLVGMTQKLAGGMEQTEIAFNTFLGSAKKGREVLENLNEFANRTPYTNEQIIKTGRSLLAANVPAEKLTDTLGMIGDIASGANVPITDLGAIYAKVMNKGKLQAEELNQLAERGIPIIDQLSKEFGVTKQQVFELGSKGKITSDVMIKAFGSMTKEGGKFFKLMDKQSQSAVGLLSTLQGKTEMLGINIGKRLLPAQKKLTRQTISLVDKLNDWVKIPVSEEIKAEQKEINSLVARLTSANTSEAERKNLLKEIEQLNPQVTKGIDSENISTEKLVANLQKYNEEAVKKIVLANLEVKEQKQLNRQAKIQSRIIDSEIKALERVQAFKKEIAFDDRLTTRQKIEAAKKELSAIVKTQLATGEATKIRSNEVDLRTKEQKLLSSLSYHYATILEHQKDLNDESEDSLKISNRVAMARKLLGLGASATPDVITGKIQGAEDVTAGITKITAAAPKVFNININNLVENFEISTTNLPEAQVEIKNQVTQALLEGLADVQPLVR